MLTLTLQWITTLNRFQLITKYNYLVNAKTLPFCTLYVSKLPYKMAGLSLLKLIKSTSTIDENDDEDDARFASSSVVPLNRNVT